MQKRVKELVNKLKEQYALEPKILEAHVRQHIDATFDELCDFIDDEVLKSEVGTEDNYDYGDEVEELKTEEAKGVEDDQGRLGTDQIICEDVLLSSFKVTKCKRKAAHNPAECKNFHDVLDRRRRILNHWYSSKPCASVIQEGLFIDPRNCPYRDACLNAHTRNEIYYHPDFFRTKTCAEIKAKCQRKAYCPFNHNQAADDHIIEEEKARAAAAFQPKAAEQAKKTTPEPREEEAKGRHERKNSLCMYCVLRLKQNVKTSGRCTCHIKNRILRPEA